MDVHELNILRNKLDGVSEEIAKCKTLFEQGIRRENMNYWVLTKQYYSEFRKIHTIPLIQEALRCLKAHNFSIEQLYTFDSKTITTLMNNNKKFAFRNVPLKQQTIVCRVDDELSVCIQDGDDKI
jgi:hypothetical protein